MSAIRFYESRGLVAAERASSGHRRFRRSAIRRVSFVRICQQLGYTLGEIKDQLDELPEGRTPTEDDWAQLATSFASDIESRIKGLSELQAKLDRCIGCGCLSLQHCQLHNREDNAADRGTGPRYLMGDQPSGTTSPG